MIKMMSTIALLTIGTTAGALAGDVTVGRFYIELAQAKHLAFVDAASAEANLRGAGYELPQLPLKKSLTEADVTGISNALGVAVSTHRPSKPFSDGQLSTYMAVFGHQLGKRGSVVSPFHTNDDEQGEDDDDQGHDHHHHHHDHDHDHDHDQSRCLP